MMAELKAIRYIVGFLCCFLLGVLISPYLDMGRYHSGSHNPRQRFIESVAPPIASRVKEQLSRDHMMDTWDANIVATKLNRTFPGSIEGGVSLSSIDLDVKTPDIDELYKRLVIVTAFSHNHFEEAKGVLGTAQNHMPGKKIVVYDLGLEDEERKVVQSFCNVEVRQFPFENYPEYVSKLLVYAWKPIIINITLNEFGAIFWADASVRFGGNLKELLPFAEQHHGYLAYFWSFDPKKKAETGHQYYFTYEGMFEYMGINRILYYEEEDSAPHATANRQLFINSSTIQTKLVQPLVECALNIDCISPKGSKWGTHRYDASALALFIYKNMKYEFTPERNANKQFLRIARLERENGEKYHPHGC